MTGRSVPIPACRPHPVHWLLQLDFENLALTLDCVRLATVGFRWNPDDIASSKYRSIHVPILSRYEATALTHIHDCSIRVRM